MIAIKGLGAAEGFVKAKAFVLKEVDLDVSPRLIENPEEEKKRVMDAIAQAGRQIDDLTARAKELKNGSAEIFEAHKMMLTDTKFSEGICDIIENEGVCAEYACQKNAENLQALFAAIEDEYMRARAADIIDISKRVLRILKGITENPLDMIEQPCIIVANDLTPSDTARIGEKPVYGFVTRLGGKTSHSAIMARTMGIAAVVGVGDEVERIEHGTPLLVNGEKGIVIADPDEQTETQFDSECAAYKEQQKLLEVYKERSGATSDGIHIIVEGNIGTPAEANRVKEMGGEGIGLFRSEFLFMDRPDLPGEEEQFQAYKEVTEIMKGKPVIIRTLDIGGDKEVPALRLEKEENPFLGYRAIRLCLEREDLFMPQLRALLRAGIYGDIRIMFPMISSLKELRDAKVLLKKAEKQLYEEGVPCAVNVKVGIMIEIPAVAACADILAPEVDFFSIGTNDLIQYSCAVDRINEKVSHLYNILHPGVLRLIKNTADAGRKAGIDVGVCGEMAGMKGMPPILCGLGVTSLSMAASSILNAKAELAKYTFEECRKVAEKLLNDNEF